MYVYSNIIILLYNYKIISYSYLNKILLEKNNKNIHNNKKIIIYNIMNYINR